MSGADTGLTVATWNMEWKAPGSAAATIMLERLHAAEPDVICFTEAYDTLDLPAGQLITAHADYG